MRKCRQTGRLSPFFGVEASRLNLAAVLFDPERAGERAGVELGRRPQTARLARARRTPCPPCTPPRCAPSWRAPSDAASQSASPSWRCVASTRACSAGGSSAQAWSWRLLSVSARVLGSRLGLMCEDFCVDWFRAQIVFCNRGARSRLA